MSRISINCHGLDDDELLDVRSFVELLKASRCKGDPPLEAEINVYDGSGGPPADGHPIAIP